MVVSGGFSFDWGLIQPAIAQTTRICTYDTAGTAWSDPFPSNPPGRAQTCAERVAEIHNLLVNAPEPGPYVLVGYSIGGLYARLYAATYPRDVGAMVLVDHAFLEPGHAVTAAAAPDASTTLPTVISQTPVVMDIQDDRELRESAAAESTASRLGDVREPGSAHAADGCRMFRCRPRRYRASVPASRQYTPDRNQHAERFTQIRRITAHTFIAIGEIDSHGGGKQYPYGHRG